MRACGTLTCLSKADSMNELGTTMYENNSDLLIAEEMEKYKIFGTLCSNHSFEEHYLAWFFSAVLTSLASWEVPPVALEGLASFASTRVAPLTSTRVAPLTSVGAASFSSAKEVSFASAAVASFALKVQKFQSE